MGRQVTIGGQTYTEAELDCPECGHFMVLDKRGGRLYYRCSTKSWTNCPGTHSCHPDGRPLGIPGDAMTKAARMKTHRVFDRLWKEMGMSRGDAYRWLQTVMEMSSDEAHIGRFDEAQCEDLLAILEAEKGLRPAEEMIAGDEGIVEFGFGDR